VEVDPVIGDLSVATSPRAIVDELDRRGTHVDFLVNNAGYASLAPTPTQPGRTRNASSE